MEEVKEKVVRKQGKEINFLIKYPRKNYCFHLLVAAVEGA